MNKSNNFWKKGAAVVVTVVAAAVFARTLAYAVSYSPDSGVLAPSDALGAADAASNPASSAATTSSDSSTVSASAAAAAPAMPPDDPVRLIIPALGINANVQHTGITAKDTIGTPNNFTDVAWYEYGPAPGADGAALIDGHVDNGLGLAGVFKHLSDIKAGDRITVTREDGTQVNFVVTDVQSYPYTDVPMAIISNRSGPPSLVLVTCGGAWVAGGDTYDHRLVVTAELATSAAGSAAASAAQ